MKKYLLSFLLFVFAYSATAQYTELPSYEKKKPWTTDVKLIGIGASDDDVTMTLAISGAYNFNSETCLEFIDPAKGTNQKVFMKDIWRETGEYAMRFASYGYDSFSLIFPPLPNGVNKIDLITDKVKVYGISIRPVVRSKQKDEIKRVAETEDDINQLVINSTIDIAGFYESLDYSSTKLAVVQDKGSVCIIYVSENNSVGTWKCGEVKASLRSTALPNVFKADWYSVDKKMKNVVITFDAVSMSIEFSDGGSSQYIKMEGVKGNTVIGNEGSSIWTGTGYAIGDGYIVTNNHVAGEAKNISIKGVRGDINTSFTAEVVATDKVNDLAIIRINDPNFKGFGTIPYAIQQQMADVGDEVFVLGYPLTQALGNEIKLTNGIISSRTGYQGNISTYQMSAPVQPGNSGGPMFDNKGNVIGIVVAGVPGAENVGYAIKTSYLKILIESAGLNIQFPTNNTISTLSLAEKVKRVKNFVFYIECSK